MTTKDKYNFISYDELLNTIENDTTENNFKTSAEFLMSAVTDWPTLNSQEPESLIAELKNEIKKKLNFDNIESYLKNLTATNDAWKIEAVSALLKLFDFDRKCNNNKSIELEKIVEKLTQYYRKNKCK